MTHDITDYDDARSPGWRADDMHDDIPRESLWDNVDPEDMPGYKFWRDGAR